MVTPAPVADNTDIGDERRMHREDIHVRDHRRHHRLQRNDQLAGVIATPQVVGTSGGSTASAGR